jgi:hypothetical protein
MRMNQLYKLMIFFLFIVLLSSCKSNVKGVVTYFFNDNFGQKPDVGAEIYFLEENENILFDFTVKWASSKVSPRHRENLSKIADWRLSVAKGKLKETVLIDSIIKLENEEFEDRQAAIKYFISMMKDNSLKCVANGTGEFEIDIPKGKYYVLVVFSHRDGIYISLTPEDFNSDKQLNYSFDRYDL